MWTRLRHRRLPQRRPARSQRRVLQVRARQISTCACRVRCHRSRLEDLAVPFSRELCSHLKEVDTQSTSSGSRFLDACRHFNAGRITQTELIETTALLGFNNVIDAFHVVDRADVGTRFFVDERQQSLRGIRFTDELLELASDTNVRDPLMAEAESRWRLVESAWHERRSTGNTLRVEYDRPSEMIVRGMLGHRRSITWVRPGLSGYQASACFYCGAPVTPLLGLEHSADVDHYFPHMLMSRGCSSISTTSGIWSWRVRYATGGRRQVRPTRSR